MIPNGGNIISATHLTSGEIIWSGQINDPRAGPDAVEFGLDGEPRLLSNRPGDDVAWAVSPDGEFALVAIEPRYGADRYTQAAILVNRETGATTTLYDAGTRLGAGGRWSPDGLKIPIVPRFGASTVIFLSPTGRELASLTFPDSSLPHGLHWCEDSVRVGAVVRSDTEGVPMIANMETGVWTPLTEEDTYVTGALVCVGSGHAWAFYGILGERSGLVVVDHLADQVFMLDTLRGSRTALLGWIPDRAPPTISGIRIEPAQVQVVEGSSALLTATLVTSRGDSATIPTWSATSPSVSVDAAGNIRALRPGTGWVLASHRGWLVDSVQVRVVPAGPDVTLLDERFETFDTTAWRSEGEPRPRIVSRGDRQVLSHNGDGRYSDPIFSRATFSAEAGLTLPMDVEISFTLRDRQRMTICLDSGGGSWLPSKTISIQEGAVKLCLTIPDGEGDTRREGWGLLSNSWLNTTESFALPDDFDSSRWTSVALQIGPDGYPTVAVDGRVAFRSRRSVGPLNGPEWRIVLAGAADQTEFLFRNLKLSRGVRY